jgi:hypothetical protein
MYIPRYLLSGALGAALAVSSAACWSQYGDQGDSTQYSGDADDYNQYDQPVEYANEAPPPLPEYQQPMCPGEGYIWTPGYWYWGPEGFFWVPGAWVFAPYQGALWTPGYWSFYDGRYGWHRGFWGRQVGYYGGIDYGYGYTGYGYEGGRWEGDRFAYNRAVNNVNVAVTHNVYDYRVENRGGSRVSYNGPGGVRVRPRPAEIQAIREPHTPPMSSQLQHVQQAQQIRQNFARVNHGRPQVVVDRTPIPADRNVRPPASVSGRQGMPPSNGDRNGDRRFGNGEAPRPGQGIPRNEPARPDVRNPQQRGHEAPRANPARPAPPMRNEPAPRQQQPAPRNERPVPMPRPEHNQPAPQRQAPERHANPAPDRQAPVNPRPPMQQQRPAPVERPAPQQYHPQRPPQSRAPEHREGPPPARPDEKKPH